MVVKVKRHHTAHGESRKGNWTPEYRAYVNMMTRCYNPKSTRYKNWGGRGVRVCEEWHHNYPAFLAHIGRRPSPKHSLDRWPNAAGNYEPGNVRWASPKQQARNQRSNRIISAFGLTMSLAAWSDHLGIKYGILLNRLFDGWTVERAFTQKPKGHGYKEIARVA